MITKLLSLSQCLLNNICDSFTTLLVNALVVLGVDVKLYLIQTLRLTPNLLAGSGSYKTQNGTKQNQLGVRLFLSSLSFGFECLLCSLNIARAPSIVSNTYNTILLFLPK